MQYILIPTFNESENLPLLFSRITSLEKKDSIFYVFVDDGSFDNTATIIQNYFSNKWNYKLITKESNQGPGHSFNLGFEWILTHSNSEKDIIITMEADNTSDITILPRMITISELGYDLVLASVYAQGGGFEKTSLFRKVISLIANMLFRSFYGVKVLTLSSFYRVYSVSIVQKIKENNKQIIEEKGFICMLEILLKAIKENATVIEVPMILKSEMRKGKSKMKILKTTKAYLLFLLKKSFKN
jgi:dolichol-phosphate mannosyltransferase